VVDTGSNRTPPRTQSDFVATLLRDPTSSHLLETLMTRAPSHVFDILWSVYISAALPRLAVHPIANFVVAKALRRCNKTQLAEAVPGLRSVAGKLVGESAPL
jgi:nucleolar protein 9